MRPIVNIRIAKFCFLGDCPRKFPSPLRQSPRTMMTGQGADRALSAQSNPRVRKELKPLRVTTT